MEDPRVDTLTRQVNELSQVVTRLQEELRRGANYKNDDVEKRVNGIQACLERAATVQSRKNVSRRRT